MPEADPTLPDPARAMRPGSPCMQCRRTPPLTALTLAPCRYEFPADRLVQELKFHGRLPAARVLGHLLAQAATAAHANRPLPAALVPIPLHRKRLRERGFNQAERIAREAGRRLGIPVNAGAVERTRHTSAQSGLDLALRQGNLAGAFRVVAPLPPHVAVIDDVITSGSTMLAVAETLAAAGVTTIEAWSATRTL